MGKRTNRKEYKQSEFENRKEYQQKEYLQSEFEIRKEYQQENVLTLREGKQERVTTG